MHWQISDRDLCQSAWGWMRSFAKEVFIKKNAQARGSFAPECEMIKLIHVRILLMDEIRRSPADIMVNIPIIYIGFMHSRWLFGISSTNGNVHDKWHIFVINVGNQQLVA